MDSEKLDNMKKCGVFGVIPDGACSNTFHINFHFSWNSVGPIKQSWPDALGRHSHCKPSPAEQNRTESDRLSSAQLYGRSLYTSSPILTACSIFSAPRRSWRVTSRRCRREDWASLSSFHSRRVAFSVRYALYTWRVVQGLARRLTRHSHCKPSRTEHESDICFVTNCR